MSERVTWRLLTTRLGSPVIAIVDLVVPLGLLGGGMNWGTSPADWVSVVSTTGPIVVEMTRGPAGMVIGWYQMFRGKAMTAPVAGLKKLSVNPSNAGKGP